MMNFAFHQRTPARAVFLMAACTVLSSPAFAQLEKAKSTLSMVQAWILGIAVVLTSIAIMFVGFRMMFQAAQWKDVAPIFWGAVLAGSSTAIATMLVG